MTTDIELMLDLMDNTFQDYENSITSKPEFVKLSFGYVYRFKEKHIYQAMIQKLARVQSLVRAAMLLLEHGYVQEQTILHRAIDEANDDIIFLAYAIINDDVTELHERFLAAFWEEEIDESGTMFDSKQKRPMIPRKQIRHYLANIEGQKFDPETHKEVDRTITNAYSGFVHGASPQIMDMYGGNPPHFHTKGMLGTPRIGEHANDLWNYVYRSFLSHIAVGIALGAENHVKILTERLHEIERINGMRE